jgi:hypothetical protein
MTITNATHGRVARRARREETRLCTDERPQDVIRDSWCRRHAVGPASWRRVNDRYHIWKDPAVLGRTSRSSPSSKMDTGAPPISPIGREDAEAQLAPALEKITETLSEYRQ